MKKWVQENNGSRLNFRKGKKWEKNMKKMATRQELLKFGKKRWDGKNMFFLKFGVFSYYAVRIEDTHVIGALQIARYFLHCFPM